MKQNPCHLVWNALWVGTLLLSLTVFAGQARESKPTMDQLANGVVHWAARQRGLEPTQVRMEALDSRVVIKKCNKEPKYEFPISSFESIKVSCIDPAWYLFVRVKYSQPQDRPPAVPAHLNKPVDTVEARVESRQVWVASQFLSSGSPVTSQQLSLESRANGQIGLQALDPKTDFTFMEATHDLPPGTILRQYDIRPKILVKRGQMVQMNIGQGQGFQISARVEAMQDGRYGEQIRVKNAESGRILSGTVKGPGLVSGS